MERRTSAVIILVCILVGLQGLTVPLKAQSHLQRLDSLLTRKYQKDIDTSYVVRPETKWTVKARVNVSGAEIESEGVDNGQQFKSEMKANRKTTLSLAVSYLGLTLSAALNPGKLAGKYHDYELNFNSYGRRFGFDIIYQDAKNFTGWHDHEGMERIQLPDGILKVKTLNLNAFYVFNSRRFSYPAAFSQSYIQRRSAGSFMLAASGMGQDAKLNWEQPMRLKMTNIAVGGGYGYNFVPWKGWLLHISALPTFIVYSHTSMTFDNSRVPLHYHFPEVIMTGRTAVIRQWSNMFLGISTVFNFTNIGDKDDFTVYNTKWRFRAFYGIRLGKKKQVE